METKIFFYHQADGLLTDMNHLKAGLETTTETYCVSNVLQKLDNVKRYNQCYMISQQNGMKLYHFISLITDYSLSTKVTLPRVITY